MPDDPFLMDTPSTNHTANSQSDHVGPTPDKLLSYEAVDIQLQYSAMTTFIKIPPVRSIDQPRSSFSSGTITPDLLSLSNFPPNKDAAQNAYDNFIMELPPAPIPLGQPSPRIKGSDFIRQYDPWDPEASLAEKRCRDKAELDQQKEDAVALKRFGGSCIWCIRAKKKCEAVMSCKLCSANKRTCYRDVFTFCGRTSLRSPDLPSQRARRALEYTNHHAFEHFSQVTVTINIVPHNQVPPWTWIATKRNTTWPNSLDCPSSSLVHKIVNRIATDLLEFEKTCGTHQLLHIAFHMAKVFTASQWLVQTRVTALSTDIIGGRPVILYLLVVYFRGLFETSGPFCEELFHALRKHQPRDKAQLDPLWVACALYYRIVQGMRDLQTNPLVASILGLNCSLDGVCSAIEEILWTWIPRDGVTDTTEKKKIFRDEIPTLQPNTETRMEFWQNVRYDKLELLPSIEIAQFLLDEFPEPPPVPLPLEMYEQYGRSSEIDCIDPGLLDNGEEDLSIAGLDSNFAQLLHS